MPESNAAERSSPEAPVGTPPGYEDSGLCYCTAHCGVIDTDEDICDFARDDFVLVDAPCTPTPLLYRTADAA